MPFPCTFTYMGGERHCQYLAQEHDNVPSKGSKPDCLTQTISSPLTMHEATSPHTWLAVIYFISFSALTVYVIMCANIIPPRSIYYWKESLNWKLFKNAFWIKSSFLLAIKSNKLFDISRHDLRNSKTRVWIIVFYPSFPPIFLHVNKILDLLILKYCFLFAPRSRHAISSEES